MLAHDEAARLGHNYIGTEHILVALLRERDGLAARVLESLDITLEELRAQVARVVGAGDEVAVGEIPFTPRAKKVLELSLREAMLLGHNHIGTEHILLALGRVHGGVAAQILLDFDADAETTRSEVLSALSSAARGEWRPAEDAIDMDTDVMAAAVDPAPNAARAPLLVGIVAAAVGFPLGLLVGFLIWG